MDISQIQTPDAPGLRRFALTMAIMVGAIFGLVIPWVFSLGRPLWPWGISAIFLVWGVVSPASLGPVFRGWMRFGLLANKVTAPIILGLIFYLMFVPIGLFMKVIGRDTMNRQRSSDTDSFREPKSATPTKQMERPF